MALIEYSESYIKMMLIPGLLFQILSKFLPFNIEESRLISGVFQNSAWLISDKIYQAVAGVGVTILLARYLGPSDFGNLAFVITFMAIFQVIANLGMDNLMLRDIGDETKTDGAILGTVFTMRLATGLLCWLVGYIAHGLIYGFDAALTVLIFIALTSLIFQSAEVIDIWFRSQGRSKVIVLYRVTIYTFSNIAKVLLVLYEANLTAFVVMLVVEFTLYALAFLHAYRSLRTTKNWSVNFTLGLSYLKESAPYILSGLSIMIYMRFDQILLKQYLGNAQLGIYAAVIPLATIWYIIPTSLTSSIIPFVSEVRRRSEKEYMTLLRKVMRLYAIFGWIVFFCTLLIAPYIVPFLYGSAYDDSILALIIFSLTNLFVGMGMARSLWIVNERKPSVSLYSTLIGAIICILGNIVLIPLLGMLGCAIVAVLTQFVSSIGTSFFLAKPVFFIQIQAIIKPIQKN